MKKMFFIFAICLFSKLSVAAEPITGIWRTIDDETNEPKSLVQIYEYKGKVFGRVIKLFKNRETKAVGIKDNPKIEGLDIIWDMKDSGDTFSGGKILDPKKGKIYNCEIWIDKDDRNLIVRGKIGPFGRNQKWIKEDSERTDSENLFPTIPEQN